MLFRTSRWTWGLSQIRLAFLSPSHSNSAYVCLSLCFLWLADEGPSWLCDFVSAYHGLVPECCSFSADGSLLAVAFQEVVTVWNPSTWELLTTLSQPPGAVRSARRHTQNGSNISTVMVTGLSLLQVIIKTCTSKKPIRGIPRLCKPVYQV